MADLLLIRPEDRAAQSWRWRSVDAAGGDAHGSGALAQAAALAAGRRVVLLVPGESILLTTARVPVRARSKALTAVPWALEDRLVADVEGLHFALGEYTADGDWQVAVIDRETLSHLLQTAHEAGVAPHVALPEPLALPEPGPGCWHALEEPGRVVCRTGTATGFACAAALLPSVAGAWAVPERVERAAIAGTDVHWPEAVASRLAAADGIADPLQAFAPGAAARLDLLQGPFSRSERLGRLWRRWRAPAALAAVLVVLLAVHWGLAYRALAQREAALESATEQLLRAAAPDITRIVDPRVQLANRLEAARSAGADGDGGMLAVLGRAGPVLDERNDVSLVALEWRGDTLDLTVQTSELAALDRLQRGLQARGFAVELRAVEQGEERVRGEVRVTEGPA